MLRQTISSASKSDGRARIAVVGIGHDLNGDDAAGLAVVRGLPALNHAEDRLLILDGGPAPENQTGHLRAFRPDLVLLVDAAQMNEEPGTVRLIPWQDTTGLSASTHTLPPYMLAKYLSAELGCDVTLLGIQPYANRFDSPLSPGMQRVVDDVIQNLAEVLSSSQ